MAQARGEEPRQLNVSFALRLTPKADFSDVKTSEEELETHAIQELRIGEEHFIVELGRTTVYE